MSLRPLVIASCSALFLLAAGASAAACHCHSHHARTHARESLELNGKLHTADFTGGVGQYAMAEEDEGYGYGSGYGNRPQMMMFGGHRGRFGFGFHSGGFGFHGGGMRSGHH